jgi:hypothetical protein
MTVRVASTTDTVAQVKALTQKENADPPQSEFSLTPDEAPESTEPTEKTVEASDASPEEAADDATQEETPEVEASDEATEKPAPKRRRRGRSYKEKVSQLTREKQVETLRANRVQAELDSLKRQQYAAPPPQPEPAEEAPVEEAVPAAVEAPEDRATTPEEKAVDAKPVEPSEEDFETYSDYNKALIKWNIQNELHQEQAGRRESLARDQAQRAQAELVAAHRARIDEFKSEHEDFEAVIRGPHGAQLTKPMEDTIVNSELGPALMYHLTQNPEEANRIARLHPMMAVKEMGKLEARLETAPTGPVSSADPVTKAPRPIKPVGGGATASTVPLDDMPYQDYRRIMNKREADERNQR